MYIKKKSTTQANSTMVKSKITWAKNNHKTTRKELLELKINLKKKIYKFFFFVEVVA